MPRTKNWRTSHKRKKKMFLLAKGKRGARSKLLRSATEAVERALNYAYRDRRVKKREFRKLWIIRINAAVRRYGLSYSQFIHRLSLHKINLNRKVLADMAVSKPKQFEQLIQTIQDK